jgi:hypothetical protein
MLAALLLGFALSIFVCVLAAARGSAMTLALAAGLFAIQVLLAVLRIDVPFWRRARAEQAADFEWAWSNTMLTALAYAWGATAMFTIYSLTGLAWRHWWQYGALLGLFALGALLFAHRLSSGSQPTRASSLNFLPFATGLQLAAVATALAYLVSSGKLATEKADWAANVVFLAGGVTVVAISLASLYTYRRRRVLEPRRP